MNLLLYSTVGVRFVGAKTNLPAEKNIITVRMQKHVNLNFFNTYSPAKRLFIAYIVSYIAHLVNTKSL